MAKPRPRPEASSRSRRGEVTPQFDLLLHSLPLPVWVCEARTLRILAVNRPAIEQYGYSRREFLKMRVSDLRSEGGSEPPLGRMYLRRKDGSLVNAEIASGPCTYEGRAATWFMAYEMPSALFPMRETLFDGQDAVTAPAQDITERKQAEQALRRRDAILEAVSFAATQFLREADLSQSTQEALEHLGKATQSSRAYVFQNHTDPEGNLLTTQRFEWAAPGITPQIQNPSLKGFPYLKMGFERWVEVLGAGRPLYGPIRDFPPAEREVLAAQDILSIAVVPIFVEGKWWGFIGFDECLAEREWQSVELDALLIAAGTFGAALERERTRKALEDSEVKYRTLIEQLPAVIYAASGNARGPWHYVSPQIETLLGYSPQECLADLQFWKKHVHPDDCQRVLQESAQAVARRQRFSSEYRLLTKEGRAIWVHDEATPFNVGGRMEWQGVLLDITALKQTQESLHASEAELRTLFATLPDVVMVLDRDGRYLKIAPTHPEMLYRPIEELLGKRLHEIFSTPKADELLGYIREALEKQQIVHFEYALLIGGRVMWFAGAASPLTADTVVWVGRDITARKQAEEELQQRLNELSTLYEIAQRLQQILSPQSLAHEISDILERALRYEHSAVFLLNEPSGTLVPFAVSDEGQKTGGRDLAEQVARSGQSLCLGDVRSAVWQDARSVLCVPLRFGNRIIGVVEVESTRSNAFRESDQRLLETVSAQIAIAIQNARLYEETARRLTEVEALYQSSLSLGRSLERRTIGEEVVRVLSEHLRWHHAAVHLRRGESDEVELVAFSQAHPTDTLPTRHVLTRVGEGLPGWVIKHGRMINSGNLRSDPRYREIFPGMNSGLYAPIWAGGRVIGCISVESEQREAFSEEDERLVIALASQAAIAFENARLYREAVRAAERRSILHAASQEIARLGQDLEQVYAATHRAASRLMPTEAFVIALLDEVHQEIEGVYLFDKSGRSPRMRVPLGKGLSGQVIQSGTSLLIQDNLEAKQPGVHFGDPEAVRSILAVPMQVGGRVIGVISAQSYRPGVYTEEDQLLLEMLAAQTAIAIENVRLFEQTRRRMNELEALTRASQALTSEMQSPSLLEHILRAAVQAIPAAEQGAIFLREEADTHLHLQAQIGWTDARPVESMLEVNRAYQEKRPLLILDATQAGAGEVQSAVAAPLLLGEEATGVIILGSRTRREAFDERDLQLLTVFASSAAALIERTRLFEETRRRADEFQALYQIASEMSSQTDLSTLLRTITQHARALSGTAGSGLYLFDAERRELELVAVTDPDIPTGLRLALGEGLSGQVAQRKEPLVVNDYQAWEKRPALYKGFGFTSVLGVPLLYHGELIGVLTVHHRAGEGGTQPRRGFTERDINVLSLLANAAAGAVYSARLFGRLKHRVDQLSAIHAVDMAIGATTDLRVSLQAVLDNITRLLEVDAAAALLLNPATLILQPIIATGFLTSSITQTFLPLGKSLAGEAALQKRTIYADEAAAKAEFAQRNLTAERFVAYVAVPLLVKGEVKGILEIFQRRPLNVNQEWASFLEMIAAQAALAVDNALLFENLDRTNTELIAAYDATIQGWSQALELRDRETQGHSQRVLDLTLRIAYAMGLSGKEIQNLRRGVLLHDIGKMGIPDSILHKKGALTKEEWATMRKHPQYAYDMLAPITYLREALDIPYCHHEKWDGSGYPRGLKGEAIPLSARIFAVADVYDALTSNRSYRPACTKEQALEHIRSQAGKHFDPRVVEVFLKIMESG